MKIFNFLRARFRKFITEEEWLNDHIKAGMKVGVGCDIHSGLKVDHSHCWLIEIGDKVTIAPEVYLLAHDASTDRIVGYTRIGKVKIENNAFIGARSLIMPGVTVGESAIVAAGSVVVKNVEPNTIVGGNPAKFIMNIADYKAKHVEWIKTAIVYDHKWLLQNGITTEMKDIMNTDLATKKGYVV